MITGMLLHTFADTYAHQLFTGYAEEVNSVELISATDDITGEDVTQKYHFWIEECLEKLEEIGHVKQQLCCYIEKLNNNPIWKIDRLSKMKK